MERLSVEDGLSQGFVTDVLQTRNGFLWFATLDGLNRYDGVSFEVFQPDQEQRDFTETGIMKRLFEDSRGFLWVLFDHSLGFLDQRTERFFFIPKHQIPDFSNAWEDGQGRIWGVAPDLALFRLSFPAGQSRAEDCLSGLKVESFPNPCGAEAGQLYCHLARAKSIWIGAQNGVFEVPYDGSACSRLNDLPLAPVSRIWIDSTDGAVWLYSGSRLFRYANGQTRSFQLDSDAHPTIKGGYSNGLVTCFFSQRRIYQWHKGQLHGLPWEIPEGILSGCVDRNGILWIGTNARGIRKIALDHFYFKPFAAGHSIVRPLVIGPDGQWWLMGSADFRRYNLSDDQFSESFLPGKNAYFLIRSDSGHYWMLRGNALCRMERPGENADCYQSPQESYCAFEADRRGRLLMGVEDKALIRFDPATRQFSKHSYAALLHPREPTFVRAIAEDRTGRLWIGTTSGLILATPRLPDEDYDFRLLTARRQGRPGLTHSEVLSLLPDPSDADVCWAGTKHGLNRIDLGSGEYRQLTVRDGLPNDVICSILPDDDNHIWLGTYNGLIELDTRSFNWRHFTTDDGLPSNEFNHRAALRLPDGRLFFGGVNGFTVFDPKDTRPWSVQTPRLALTALYVGHRRIRAGDSTGILQAAIPFTRSVSLSHEENNLIIQFALLDFFQAKSNQYAYRMQGLHNDWIELGIHNQAAFSNLPPGNYLFEVQARNKEGVFSQPLALSITIRRPWWSTGWAYFLYFMLFLSAIVTGGYVWHERRQINKRLEAEQREAERLKELEQFKSRLFSNYTHEFRTPLAIISSLAGQLRRLTKGNARKLVGEIEQQAEEMLQLTGQILDLTKLDENRLTLRPEPLDLSDYLAHLCPAFKLLADAKNIAFTWELPAGPVWADIDGARLRDILYNLVSNAIKFTPEGGSVLMALKQPLATEVSISVKDTGIGLEPEHLEKIFERHYQVVRDGLAVPGTGIGLSYVAELTRAMGGRIAVGSEPGKGSVFTLSLPLTNPSAGPSANIKKTMAPDSQRQQVLPVQLSYPDQPHVLIIEDNLQIAKLVAGYLASDFKVDFAANGRLGFRQTLEQLPDIVLCDLRMPEMDGIAFCQALRANRQTSHIPVVILTAFTDEADCLRAMQAGANAWLTKPVNPEVLRRQLNSFLQLRRQLQENILQNLQEPAGLSTASPDFGKEQEFVQQMMAVIAKRFDDPEFSVAQLQQELNLSKSQLHRKLLSVTGHPAIWFIRKYRLEAAKKLLQTHKHLGVAEVAYRVGFTDPNYFSRVFTIEFGKSPSAYREQTL